MLILIDGVKYHLLTPEKEAYLERNIEENYRAIFGKDSIYFPKKKIKSRAGIETIPDAFLITFGPKLKWSIVEVELASHPVYNHVFPQLTKFRRAAEDSSTRRHLTEFFYDYIKSDIVLEAKFKQQIGSGEIYKAIADMVAEKPRMIVAIDEKTKELEEALIDFGGEVEVIEFKVFRREGISEEVNAFLFEAAFTYRKQARTTSRDVSTSKAKLSSRKGTIINAVYSLFDEKGVDNVTYRECEELAKQIKPDTAFNKNHFSWYKRDYRTKRDSKTSASEKKAKKAPVSYHEDCIRRISAHLNKVFVKKRRSLYSTTEGDTNLVCLVSKAYIKGREKKVSYWYGFDPSHKDFLLQRKDSFVALGCGSADKVLLMPAKFFIPLLDNMNKTEGLKHSHWHVKINEKKSHLLLEQPFGKELIEITEYVLRNMW
ncbi:MAG: hypothetical protein ACYS8Y_11170 [Planctomycetota bacterium]